MSPPSGGIGGGGSIGSTGGSSPAFIAADGCDISAPVAMPATSTASCIVSTLSIRSEASVIVSLIVSRSAVASMRNWSRICCTASSAADTSTPRLFSSLRITSPKLSLLETRDPYLSMNACCAIFCISSDLALSKFPSRSAISCMSIMSSMLNIIYKHVFVNILKT